MSGSAYKRRYLVSLLAARNSFVKNFSNGEENEENLEYLTFITSQGYISGRFKEDLDLPYESHEVLSQAITDTLLDEGKQLDIFSIASASSLLVTPKEEIDENYEHVDNTLVLEDVTIKNLNNGSTIKLPAMVLFLDQVIGVIPGNINSQM